MPHLPAIASPPPGLEIPYRRSKSLWAVLSTLAATLSSHLGSACATNAAPERADEATAPRDPVTANGTPVLARPIAPATGASERHALSLNTELASDGGARAEENAYLIVAFDLSGGAGTHKVKVLFEGDELVQRLDGGAARACDLRPGDEVAMEKGATGIVLSLSRKPRVPRP